ncbi:MAG TPA: uracil-DNA glycosylase [Polyangiaceae bacterium]
MPPAGARVEVEPYPIETVAVPAMPAQSDAPAGVAPASAMSPAERAQRLELIAQEVAACTRCILHAGRTQTVFARGTGSARLCFVGEGPGADEDAQGYPFVGKAGQLLDRMIVAMGFSRDQVYVANIVKCRPPNNRKPEPDEMAVCVGYLHRQIELIQPEVIVALGATAVEGLLGVSGGITRLRGTWRLYRGRIAVMPTYHPAYLLRNPAAKRAVWDDLQAVLRHMGRPIPSRK